MSAPTHSSRVRHLPGAAFVLNAPFSLDSRLANNATMEKLGVQGRRLNRGLLFAQWQALYHHLAARSLVYLLPSQAALQDLPYVANLGIVPAHTREHVVVLAKFRAPGRAGETAVGKSFFEAMGFRVETCPAFFEGEADLKYLRRNIYFGGYGLRSSLRAHAWLEERHRFKIIPVPLFDPHLYHLDCLLHVLGPELVLLATAACSHETRRAVERVAEIIDVPLDLAYRGVTNVARVEGQLLGDSLLPKLKASHALYRVEKAKRQFWEKVVRSLQLELVCFDLSEFHKSGAMLSCLVLPLNYPHLRAGRGVR